MRKILAFTALAAPFVLLACGSDVEDAETNDEMAEAETISMPADDEPIGVVTLADNDVSGDYTIAGDDGTSSTLSLNSSDMTYDYTDASGETRRGNYGYYDDYRLMIEDFDGSDAWFSYDNNSLYRLASETSLPDDRITVTAQYDRDNTNASQVGGPGAVTSNVGDKRE